MLLFRGFETWVGELAVMIWLEKMLKTALNPQINQSINQSINQHSWLCLLSSLTIKIFGKLHYVTISIYEGDCYFIKFSIFHLFEYPYLSFDIIFDNCSTRAFLFSPHCCFFKRKMSAKDALKGVCKWKRVKPQLNRVVCYLLKKIPLSANNVGFNIDCETSFQLIFIKIYVFFEVS